MHLKESQKIKFLLLRAMGNVKDAEKAFDFIMEYKEVPCMEGREVSEAPDKDVSYIQHCVDAHRELAFLIYEDGHHELFTGENDKDGIRSIGIIFGGRAFAVALKDLPKQYALVRDSDECEKESPLYKRGVDAIFDWDAEAHTKHIVEAGTDIPLNDGEFIPTAAMLVAMYRMREQLNKALEYAGGEPMKTDDYYWSSSESGQLSSWILHFGNGNLGNGYKCTSNYVRPCTAFNL